MSPRLTIGLTILVIAAACTSPPFSERPSLVATTPPSGAPTALAAGQVLFSRAGRQRPGGRDSGRDDRRRLRQRSLVARREGPGRGAPYPRRERQRTCPHPVGRPAATAHA